ncbi:hypothetical protein [Nitrosomonas ureae]|uniref:hypothetical protein n=1 Tax=Nitrosomonas ureae TaxID=44577 RepID=UPI001C42F57C|nr:hypothetical protein [Nitrosomonas ureae]
MSRFFNKNGFIGFHLFDPLFIRFDHRLAIRLNQPVHHLFDCAIELLYLTLHRLPTLRNLRLTVIPPYLEHLGRGFE